LFFGAAYGEWAEAAAEFAFELAEERVAGERAAGVRVEAERRDGVFVVGLGEHFLPVYITGQLLPSS